MFGYGAIWLSTGASVMTLIGVPVAAPPLAAELDEPPDAADVLLPAAAVVDAALDAAAVVADDELLLSPPQAARSRPPAARPTKASRLQPGLDAAVMDDLDMRSPRCV